MTAPEQDRPLTAAQIAAIIAIVDAQAAVRDRITDTAVAAALAVLESFSGWWSRRETSSAIAKILKAVQPAQRQVAQITAAHLARAATAMTGRTVRPVGAIDVTRLRQVLPPDVMRQLAAGLIAPAAVDLGDSFNGPAATVNDPLVLLAAAGKQRPTPLNPAEPYGRIADTYRYQVVAEGLSPDAARDKALLRTAKVVSTDIALAARGQAQRSLLAMKATAYRRIVRPELSRTGPCGLCIVAADRVYKTGELMALHPACVCTVLPIIGGRDPGRQLNADELGRLYAAAGGTGREGLRQIRVTLTEHGEIGPILVPARQNFRGPAEVARSVAEDTATRARAQLASLEGVLPKLIARADRGEDLHQAIGWQRNRIAELRRELAAA